MSGPSVLILTPMKQASAHLDRYFALLRTLEHPADRISLGFLVSDSTDDTFSELERRLPELRDNYARVTLRSRDFGFELPAGVPRWSPPFQYHRRAVLARSRNHLLFAALGDEDWVLWIDVDLHDYPADVLSQMLATRKDIVHPHCVIEYGDRTFDWNAWREHGRVRMDTLSGGRDLVRLDAVGGTMLLIRADVHRDGLIFPAFPFGRESRFARPQSPFMAQGPGELETEGLGVMAKEMGIECWGMPNLEIVHHID